MQGMCIDRPVALNGGVCIGPRVGDPANWGSAAENMTAFGMFPRDTSDMFNIELARIIQTEREQEIQAELRRRRLLRGNDAKARGDDGAAPAPRLQRRASGATSR